MIETSLGAVAYINPSSVGNNYSYKEIDYIDISSVGSGVLMGTTHYNISDAPSRAKRLVSHGDTILSTVRPNRRSFLFIKNPSPNIVVSTGFAVLRASDKLNPRFLYYLITNQPFTDYLTANAKGAAYPAVDTEIIARAKIKLPDVHSQHKIASILSAYDDLIENNNRRIKILEEMAQAIYREWFVNFRFPGHEKVKMVKSELGMIPEGWEVKKLGDICDYLVDGDWIETKDQGGNDYRLLQVSNIGVNKFVETGNFRYVTQETFHRLRCTEILPGDILISRMPKPTGRAWLVYKMPWRTITAVDVAIAKVNSSIANSMFLVHHLNLPETIALVEKHQIGTTRPRISRSNLSALPLVVPPLKLQDLFQDITSQTYCLETTLYRKNGNLCKSRDLLLPKLISGEIDVEGLDIREVDNEH